MRLHIRKAIGGCLLFALLPVNTVMASQTAYRVDISLESWNCRNQAVKQKQTLLYAGLQDQAEGNRYILFPEAQPEEILLPPFVAAASSGDEFRATRTDTFPIRGLGLLHIRKEMRLHFDEAAATVTGTIDVKFDTELAVNIPQKRQVEADLLKKSSCRYGQA